MEWHLLSYHTIGVSTTAITSFLLFLYLAVKKGKTISSYWLAGLFGGISFLLMTGYAMGYSVFATWGAYHRYLTVGTLFALWSMIGFAYYYPQNDFPKESRIILPLGLLMAIVGYIQFVLKTYDQAKVFIFEAHQYSFHGVGQLVSRIMTLFILWSIIVLFRKSMLYSKYEGGFSKWLNKSDRRISPVILRYFLIKFIVGFIKLIRPRGKEAKATRNFGLSFLSIGAVSAINVLNKAGIMSYELYAYLFATFTILAYFAVFMVYINNSPEPTTFMIKLVGIALVTLLLVFGLVANFTLTLSETTYNQKHRAEVQNAKNNIIHSKYEDLSDHIVYIMTKDDQPGIFSDKYEILFNRNNSINLEQIQKGEAFELKYLILNKTERIVKADKTLSHERARAKAINEINGTRLPALSRLYRNAGTLYTHFDFIHEEKRYEVGYSYLEYRKHTHTTTLRLLLIILGSTIAMIILFPLFFRASLVNPLNTLLSGVKKVNEGDLDVKVPIKIKDEIGFLSRSFNSMVTSIRESKEKLEDYAENLEMKVKERTREVVEKMEEVQELKIQQDGDYFLTSLLAQPLFFNANKSKIVNTEFIIHQKKKFEFRNRAADLGGDICVTGNLRFGKPDNYKRYTMAINGDAMGKSMQGAGGSLVLGVVINSIMARSAANDRVLEITPEEWLTDVYQEIHSVFKSFDGSMVISAAIFLIDDETGDAWYFNAEHPFSVLYRNEKASFIEEGLMLRKMGLDSEFEFQVFKFHFEPGDVLLLGSDGRDDINLTPDENKRTINEDEYLFLQIVEKTNSNLNLIVHELNEKGDLTDDLSLLRLTYRLEEEQIPDDDSSFSETIEDLFLKGKKLYKKGKTDRALQILLKVFEKQPDNPNINKWLGLISFKGKDYKTAVQVINKYLQYDHAMTQFWYYLSISQKALGNYKEAKVAARQLEKLEKENINNLINLADLNRLTGKYNNAKLYSNDAIRIDPENKNAKKMKTILAIEYNY